jgi:NodT family efflux transporter outer membrane factor (OMF) lipoprotein
MRVTSVKRLRTSAAVLAAMTVLTSCAVGPDFKVPASPDVNGYTKEPLAPRTSRANQATGLSQHFAPGRDIPQEWWTLFKSRALDALIKQALDKNPTLQSALSTLRASKEAVYAQEGKFLPFVDANFNPTRNQTSGALAPVPSSNANIYNLHTAQVSVSYTFDVWGLNRRTVESLQATADSQRFQVEAAYLSLTSSVVLAAINEASLRGQIDATNELISVNKKLLDRTQEKYNGGLVDKTVLALQQAALAQVEATLPPLRKALQQNRDLLSALVGVYTGNEPRETFGLDQLRLPADLPLSLPSQLIQQRPDVRAAEEQLHSASALIGVSIANMLPNFTISANGGYMNTALAGLISPQNAFWTLSANATQTIFDGGTLFHDMREARATYDAAAWSYRGTVVTAVQNVTDSLRAIQNDADALKAARDFEHASQVTFELVRKQEQSGLIDILVLLSTEQTYLQAKIQVVQARAARLADTAALFQALGGGWWNRTEGPAEKVLDVGSGQDVPLADKLNHLDEAPSAMPMPAQSDAQH